MAKEKDSEQKFVQIHYFIRNTPYTASEGIVTGGCSEAFRSTNEVNLERARKGLEARSERLRNKQATMPHFFVRTFYHPRNKTAGLQTDVSGNNDIRRYDETTARVVN